MAVEEEECPLCMLPMTDACVTPCRHIFCRECILHAVRVSAPNYAGACPLCRQSVSVYGLREVSSGKALAEPPVSTLYGCVFVQDGGLGHASYHFDSAEDCYISYAGAPSGWRLSDGSAPPSKKPFLGAAWDESSRTFRGHVEWDPSFAGSKRWDYEIVFSEDFCAPVGGKVVMDGGPRETPFFAPWASGPGGLRYLRWTAPPTTIFRGVYVQGPRFRGDAEGVASYHFDGEGDCYISYANAPPAWRLDDGSAPPAKKPFLNSSFDAGTRTFRGSVEWDPTFQEASRWVYEIVFSEDFDRVVDGIFRPFRADGEALPTMSFCDPRQPLLLSSCMFYTRKPDVLTQDLPF